MFLRAFTRLSRPYTLPVIGSSTQCSNSKSILNPHLMCRYTANHGRTKLLQNNRPFCSDGSNDGASSSERSMRRLQLFDSPKVSMPNVFSSIRTNWNTILYRFRYDRNYNAQEFLIGCKQALEFVAGCIVSGNLEPVEALLSRNLFIKLQGAINSISPEDRAIFDIKNSDVAAAYVDTINFGSGDHITILVALHAVRGHAEFIQSMKNVSQSVNKANYKDYMAKVDDEFHRFVTVNFEFKKALDRPDDDWVISDLNFFQPLKIKNVSS